MEVCLILNPKAGNGGASAELEEALIRADGVRLLRSDSNARDGARAAARDCPAEADLLIVGGGDGTIHEVVNGLWDRPAELPKPALGIIPLGTGNDFARTLCIPMDPETALQLSLHGSRRKVDLIEIKYGDHKMIGVNMCTGGFSGVLDEHLTPELKRTWGPLAYLLGAVRTIPDLAEYDTRISWDDGPPELIEAFNVVVANGRTAAGGVPAAPRANPEDGLLDVVVIRQGTAAELGALAGAFVGGDYLDHELVLYRQVRSLRVEARPGMWFKADGELLTKKPITFSVLPQALEVVVGSRYGIDGETD